ncbi:MAG: nucleotidyltransferase domain-containing protein [Myxococcota bacterium]
MDAAAKLTEYDVGLPLPLRPLDERRGRIPNAVWSCVGELRRRMEDLLGPRLLEVRLFGSYARGQFHDESDVDVLILADDFKPGERERVRDAALALISTGLVVSPLVLSVAEFRRLLDGEYLIAEDIAREGIRV